MLMHMKSRGTWLLPGSAMAGAAPFAGAHFRLLDPQSWLVENNLGDPQKLGPCGSTSADSGMPTNAVNKFQGGQLLHIKLQSPNRTRASGAVRGDCPTSVSAYLVGSTNTHGCGSHFDPSGSRR